MNRGLLVALVSAVVVLAVGVAGLAVYVWRFPPGSIAVGGAAVALGQPAVEKAYYEMDKFVTNLADTDRLRYIQFSVALGLVSQNAKETAQEAEPQVRDVVLSHVRVLTSKDLNGAGGKERLAQAIKEGLDAILPGHVTRVYITDMVIQ
ncbi:flagellar basal body-associated protein FliL [Symbiobacterium terraclitae]|uniref:Flagellar protein FliL n=1 Tax=Symbiobacterium terraclitae TaxID=557451 RepID=A0ABS4JN92_9FIRM|nr:flagellar basal body-associated FliL family protein [Symbiobacterium terraclitae]MBP2017002.1 flagellar basal body-associated protein FliL [Symbiobacterium terraclitae]